MFPFSTSPDEKSGANIIRGGKIRKTSLVASG